MTAEFSATPSILEFHSLQNLIRLVLGDLALGYRLCQGVLFESAHDVSQLFQGYIRALGQG
jgi:hypothetical protein